MGGLMHDKIFDWLVVDSINSLPNEIIDALVNKIFEVASLFGFSFLSDDLKIKLFICEENDFENKRKELSIQNSNVIVAFQCDINCIFVMKYHYLKQLYSKSEYVSVIIHECVHVLQFYYSRLPSKRYVWLYESIACYLAGQKPNRRRLGKVLWDNFKNNFYDMKGCYEVAYAFGEALFKLYSTEVLNIIKKPDFFENELRDVYNHELFKECY